ncbi:MAG TPA: hypothetical protein VFE13_00915 [Caulobacteraceae bacterium]|jgi:hypothetical protein|nr:hypothetical protein [Caulobacteraceae bacterium]
MKLIQVLTAAALLAAPVAASADPGDTLAVTSAAPSTCGVSGAWTSLDGGISFAPSSNGGTITYASSQLIESSTGSSNYDKPGFVVPTYTVRAPMYCNAAVTAQLHAQNGALRFAGATPPAPFGYYFPETVNVGFRNNVNISDQSASFVGSCGATPGRCSNSSANAPFTSTLNATASEALSIAAVDIRYSLGHVFPAQYPRIMVAGAYSETLTLTITPN